MFIYSLLISATLVYSSLKAFSTTADSSHKVSKLPTVLHCTALVETPGVQNFAYMYVFHRGVSVDLHVAVPYRNRWLIPSSISIASLPLKRHIAELPVRAGLIRTL